MKIVESGALICECGNQELVLVQCLPPRTDVFRILCRKFMDEGVMYLPGGEKREYKIVPLLKK